MENFFWRIDMRKLIVCLSVVVFALAYTTILDLYPVNAGVARIYYIAADEIEWNYAPQGNSVEMGMPGMDMAAASDIFLKTTDDHIGSIYRKAVYIQYTDETFTTVVERKPNDTYLGLLGPIIRAEVGDTIEVVFKNNTTIPTTIHPHGVLYKKDAEGAPYNDGTDGALRADDSVKPGEMFTYRWEVPQRAGPGSTDGESTVWLYHSHADEIGDTNAGLIGVFLIYAPGTLDSNGVPKNIDREMIVLFKIYNENSSPYLDHNVKTYPSKPKTVDIHDEDFEESNLKHSMNGYIYGVPDLVMQEGDRIRWYVLALGSEPDLHTPHWHGTTLSYEGHNLDTVSLLPGEAYVLDMLADNPGTWLFHCHVDDHIAAGMAAVYTILPRADSK
jgi:manganese oxidase